MKLGIEISTMLKSRKREITERIKLPNYQRIRKLGEKENYKHLGILEADTIKQAEMKEKFLKKSTSNERENFSKPNSGGGILSMG